MGDQSELLTGMPRKLFSVVISRGAIRWQNYQIRRKENEEEERKETGHA